MCIYRDLQFQQSESVPAISYRVDNEASRAAGHDTKGCGGEGGGGGGLRHSGNRGSTCSIAHTFLPFLHFWLPKKSHSYKQAASSIIFVFV